MHGSWLQTIQISQIVYFEHFALGGKIITHYEHISVTSKCAYFIMFGNFNNVIHVDEEKEWS